MRKILNLTFVMLLALSIASCTKDADYTGGEYGENAGNKLVFSLEGINGGVTSYALNDVPATTLEKTVDNITVYIFEKESAAGLADGKLVLSKEFTSLATTTSATLDMGSHPTLTGTYIAYFVANNSGNAFVDMSSLVVLLEDGSNAATATKEGAFRDLATKAVASDVEKSSFLMTGAYTTPFPATGTYSGIELRRRVARFDLVNKAAALTITKIEIQDANDRTNAFGVSTIPTTTSQVQPTAITSFGTWVDYKEMVNSVETVTGKESSSLFYLNPTKIPSTTTIYLHTTDAASNAQIFELTPAADFEIKSNYRYRLILGTDWKFIIQIMDWDSEDDDEIDFIPGAGTFGLVSAPIVTGGSYVNKAVSVQAATAVSFTLDMKATSTQGVSVEVVSQVGDFDNSKINTSVTTENTVSYASPYYKSSVAVSIAQSDAVEATNSFKSTLIITDIATKAIQEVVIYYTDLTNTKYLAAEGTELTPVIVGGIVWAPVNVDATIANPTNLDAASMGKVYQWGRNYSAWYVKEVNGEIQDASYTKMGYFTYEEANTTNKEKFATYYLDWLDPTDSMVDTRNKMWSPEVNDSPCPTGWRVPTKSEIGVLASLYDTSIHYDVDNKRIDIPGDISGTNLYLPLTGSLAYQTNAASWHQGVLAWLWSSTKSDNNETSAYVASFSTIESMVSPQPMSRGFSIRCVKDAI